MKDKFLLVSIFLLAISFFNLVSTQKINNLAETISSTTFSSTTDNSGSGSSSSSPSTSGDSTSGDSTTTSTSGTSSGSTTDTSTISSGDTTLSNTTSVASIINFVGKPGECSSGKIFLSWPPVSNASRYKLYRESTVIYEGNNLSFTDSGLGAGNIYHYKLLALNLTSYSNATLSVESAPTCSTSTNTSETPTPSTSQSGTTVDTATGTTDTSLTSTINQTTSTYTIPVKILPGPCGTNYIKLSWDAVDGAYGYKIFKDDKAVYNGRDLGFTSSGLEPGRLYYFFIAAYRTDGSPIAKTGKNVSAPSLCTETQTNINTGDFNTQTNQTTGAQTLTTPEIQTIAPSSTTAPAETQTSPTNALANCDFTKQYLKRSANTCLPLSNCTDEKNPEYKSLECQDVRKFDLSTGSTEDDKIEPGTTNTSVATNIIEVSKVLEESRLAKERIKAELNNLIDERIAQGLSRIIEPNSEQKRISLEALGTQLKEKVRNVLSKGTPLSQTELDNLKQEIKSGLESIRSVIVTTERDSSNDLDKIITDFDTANKDRASKFEASKGNLVFKDSNNDGISDYDAVEILKIDPNKTLPASDFEGRKIDAREKILLGFDPTKEELVKIPYEEPYVSTAPTIETYKIEDIKINDERKIVLSGKALPNSFVTLYIYSTPIIVTIKTDNNGSWQYTLDKELDNGEHTVYTASVDNSGKIVAKSTGVPFVKTAEAATIGSIPIENTANGTNNINIYLVGIIFVSLVLLAILSIGYIGNRDKDHDASNQDTVS